MSKFERLRKAREDAGYRSASAAAVYIGLSASTYRAHENGQNDFGFEDATLYARKFKVDPIWLFTGTDRADKGTQNLLVTEKMNTLQVIGVIKAGHFKDITMLDDDISAFENIHVPADIRFPASIQYALKIDGDSMNLRFPDGSYVIVIGLIESGIELKPGMTVHVERTFGGGQYVETTLKEIQFENGKTELIPRSTNPIHKPIIIEGGEDMEVQIKGVAIGAYQIVPFV